MNFKYTLLGKRTGFYQGAVVKERIGEISEPQLSNNKRNIKILQYQKEVYKMLFKIDEDSQWLEITDLFISLIITFP